METQGRFSGDTGVAVEVWGLRALGRLCPTSQHHSREGPDPGSPHGVLKPSSSAPALGIFTPMVPLARLVPSHLPLCLQSAGPGTLTW